MKSRQQYSILESSIEIGVSDPVPKLFASVMVESSLSVGLDLAAPEAMEGCSEQTERGLTSQPAHFSAI